MTIKEYYAYLNKNNQQVRLEGIRESLINRLSMSDINIFNLESVERCEYAFISTEA